MSTWKKLPALQQPGYDKRELGLVVDRMVGNGVVEVSSVQKLLQELSLACEGSSFVLQIGDCAETFDSFSEENVKKYVDTFSEHRDLMEKRLGKKVILIARMAGQFAKPRSEDFEVVDGVRLPSYRGDMANGISFDEESRRCDPQRLITAYQQSKNTVDIIERARGGKDFFVSHECLVLDYDASMMHCVDGKNYCLSGHMLWVGYRTAVLGHAHIEFLSSVENPVGIKVGPGSNPDDLLAIISKINPRNIAGKVVLIARFGSEKINNFLIGLMAVVKKSGAKVVWICDPMHGNGYKTSRGDKTRSVSVVCREVESFVKISRRSDVFPAGLHLESTAHDVTECVDEACEIHESGLSKKYLTACDPRLNPTQTKDVLNTFCKVCLD